MTLKQTVTARILQLYTHCYKFKKGYQPITNSEEDVKGVQFAGTHFEWVGDHFSQLLNVHGINDIRQTEVHTAEPLVPEPRASEDKMAIEKLKRHKSQGTDQIPAEWIKAEGRTIHSEIYKLWNKEIIASELEGVNH
jgi:hypothetical protein